MQLLGHKDALDGTDYDSSILGWKPDDPASTQQVAGGARLTGITDLGSSCDLSISPTGEIFVADFDNAMLVSFQNGSKHLLLHVEDGTVCCFSPNGVLYAVNNAALQKLVGSTLQTMIAFESFGLKFSVAGISVTKEEVIYFSDGSNRILRINPAESLEPVVVGEIPEECEGQQLDLFAKGKPSMWLIMVEGRCLRFVFTEVWSMGDRCMSWRSQMTQPVASMNISCPLSLRSIEPPGTVKNDLVT